MKTKPIEVAVKISDLEIFKETLAVLEEATIALTRIAQWDELSIEQRCDVGSVGQRDYYRRVAMDALESLKQFEENLKIKS